MKTSFILAIALLAASTLAQTQWAVIVAGSNQFYNYRHQADTCHAYQILKSHGIPANQIIHFAYDDIAHNSQNKFPGKIFNKPDGPDVYDGCVIDYKQGKVTPKNYLHVIQGEVTKHTEKVLKSGPNDKVFLNFADHGAPGLIAFPSGRLHAKDLNAALQNMHAKKMYSQLVFYVEACESGSMFPQLPADIGIYAATAANAHESSWGFYCPPDDKIKGREVGSCLGDTFSISWMEDTDLGTAGETLSAQFTNVVARTTKSHPMQFGDMSIASNMVADWIGPKSTIKKVEDIKKTDFVNSNVSTVESRDIKLHYLIWKHAREMSNESMNELNTEIVSRKNFDELFMKIGSMEIRSVRGASNGERVKLMEIEHADDAKFAETDCYELLLSSFEQKCGQWSDYGFKYFRQFYNMCYHIGGLSSNATTVRDTLNIMDSFCAEDRVF